MIAPRPTTEQRVAAACESIRLANNGYADIGASEEVAAGVQAAGFVVILTRNLFGLPTFRGFTKPAQSALASSPFGVSTYRPIAQSPFFGPDYEAAILARQERAGFYD